ncbi:MAG TPA: phosphate-starvation-inducible PsiE family protein [Ktedonosporobacter sp.]|nr:phosphate-starvation-inducible PsiE family protein [Ktedonosporobacter sp.]
MPDYKLDLQHDDANKGNPTYQQRTSYEPEDRFALAASNILDRADGVIYAAVGACFLIGALCALGYSFWDFGTNITRAIQSGTPGPVATAVIQFVSDLLLVLIIMEVLGTVTHYLKSHATSLRPFLFIGIVSATRSILSIGARLSVEGGAVKTEEFTHAMVELGVSAAVILALGLTLKLLGSLVADKDS